jgi:bifunctional DNA-binding transcriptional regulator/antitoxin component of YhaV-PrlF toxin-antitoxin module
VAKAYGLSQDDFRHILASFPVFARKHPEFFLLSDGQAEYRARTFRLESEGKWCESCTIMSATVVRAKRQTTLPEDICRAAGIRIHDQVDWRFKDGEIRGRKLVPARETVRRVRPVKFNDLLIMPQHLEVDLDRMDEELRQEREARDEHLLG